jgi:WD40 repeat protein
MYRFTIIGCFLFALLSPAALRSAPPVTAAVLSPDRQLVVVGSQSGLEVRSWPELAVVRKLETKLAHVHDLKFSPDGNTLLAAGGSPAESGDVELLNWPAGEQVRRVSEHRDVVYRVAWSPDGARWATAGGDGVCQIFEAATGERVTRYEGHSRPVLAIAYLPDGVTIATGGVDQTIRVWDARTGEHLRTLDNHVATVNDLAVRPTSNRDDLPVVVSVSEDRTVRLWQPTIGRLMRFTRLPVVPQAVLWLPAGDRLLVGCRDGRIRTIDPDSIAVIGEYDGLTGRIHELDWHASDHRALVAGEAGGIASVDVASAAER